MITYSECKRFTPEQLRELFEAVGWESGRYPQRLAAGLAASSRVISAWDGERLVGLVRGLDDGATVAFLHYLLVRPEYRSRHIGQELMRRILEGYKDMLYIKIMPSDPATQPFYARFGFELRDNYSAMVICRMPEALDYAPATDEETSR